MAGMLVLAAILLAVIDSAIQFALPIGGLPGEIMIKHGNVTAADMGR